MNRRKLLTYLPFLAAPAVLRAETVDLELVELIKNSDFFLFKHKICAESFALRYRKDASRFKNHINSGTYKYYHNDIGVFAFTNSKTQSLLDYSSYKLKKYTWNQILNAINYI